ncbi:TetR/AcrR family transcriptional regulator [Candidatus Poriferisodalis sp.]|uniref:TetR/AcrR family transcriptional regulator n=1 Tax=Candidatus Poriferisodalis sp. TaxID=3101277 RepID=UPI003B52CF50
MGRETDSDDATRRLLDAATTEFGARGYESATISEIARASGSTPDALHARWPNKRELFTAVIEHAVTQRMSRSLPNAEATAAEKLEMLGSYMLTSTRNETQSLWIEACVSARRDPVLLPAVVESFGAEADELAEIVNECKSTGVIDPSLSTEAVVFFFQSLGLGMNLVVRDQAQDRVRPHGEAWAEIVSRIIRTMGSTMPDESASGDSS